MKQTRDGANILQIMNFWRRNCGRFKALSQTSKEVLINCTKLRIYWRTSYSICELLHITFLFVNYWLWIQIRGRGSSKHLFSAY